MAYCTQCGSQVTDTDRFCGKCGRPQGGAHPAPAPWQQDPLGSISGRTASILCYVPTMGWIAAVFVLASKKFRPDRIVRFHAFQGLYLFAAWLVVQWVVRPISIASGGSTPRVDHILEILIIAVSIFMMVKASHNEAYVLPIVGELAQRSSNEHN